MSSGYQQHFTVNDLAMLDRVLARAGFTDRPDTESADVRRHASRFLIARFQRGVTEEGALHFALTQYME
jgi:hypothetical protein